MALVHGCIPTRWSRVYADGQAILIKYWFILIKYYQNGHYKNIKSSVRRDTISEKQGPRVYETLLFEGVPMWFDSYPLWGSGGLALFLFSSSVAFFVLVGWCSLLLSGSGEPQGLLFSLARKRKKTNASSALKNKGLKN